MPILNKLALIAAITLDAVCNGATEEKVLGAKDFLLSLKLCVECQIV